MLWNNPNFSKHGHKIRITRPPRYDMHVKMFGNTGTGSRAKVEANIEPLRLQGLLQYLFTTGREFEEFGALCRAQGR